METFYSPLTGEERKSQIDGYYTAISETGRQ